jgi:hypothetical protein
VAVAYLVNKFRIRAETERALSIYRFHTYPLSQFNNTVPSTFSLQPVIIPSGLPTNFIYISHFYPAQSIFQFDRD